MVISAASDETDSPTPVMPASVSTSTRTTGEPWSTRPAQWYGSLNVRKSGVRRSR